MVKPLIWLYYENNELRYHILCSTECEFAFRDCGTMTMLHQVQNLLSLCLVILRGVATLNPGTFSTGEIT